jgi:hypothetical protein
MPENTVLLPRERTRGRKRDRRALVRYASTQTSDCSVFPSCDRFPARIRNVSAGGIGLIVTRELKTDTLLLLELVRHDGTIASPVTARVTNLMRLGASCWSVGCEFDKPLGREILHDLI